MNLAWKDVQRLLAVLQPSWFAAFVIVGTSLTFQIDQTLEVIESVATDHGLLSPQHVTQMMFLIILAGSGWYFPRALLSVQYWNTPRAIDDRERTWFEQWRRYFPRALGLAPMLSLSLAYFRAGNIEYSVLYLILAVMFLGGIIWRRRRLLHNETITVSEPSFSTWTFRSLLSLLGMSIVMFWVFVLFPLEAPRLVGSSGIVLYAAASWIAFGSLVLIYPTYRFRLPSLFLVMILLSGMFSLWNDNHAIRKLPAEADPWHRDTIDQHLDAWLDARHAQWAASSTTYPVYIASAEGGGIRAGYWTASVLAKLEDTHPGFGCHLLAISGVSGGSLGGAVYASLLADRILDDQYDCATAPHAARTPFHPAVRQILGEDFLAPTLAGLFFPDLVQRLSPFYGAWAFPDRATYLELAWEDAWKRTAGSHRLNESFRRLWEGPRARYTVPSLFLNATWVDSGDRVIASNIALDPVRFARADDLVAFTPDPISTSTAIHASARFTYVSPPGTVSWKGSPRRVVDGGYFENSGTLTAGEIARALAEARERYCPRLRQSTMGDCRPPPIEPIILMISNDPHNPNNESAVTDPLASHDRHFLGETFAPWQTLFNTRSARGYVSEHGVAEEFDTVRFALGEYKHADVPLGWTLSEETRRLIDQQIDQLKRLDKLEHEGHGSDVSGRNLGRQGR